MYPKKAMKATLVEKTGNIMLPPCRGVFVRVVTPTLPRGKTEEKDRRWEFTGLFTKDADFTALEAQCKELFEENVLPKKRDGMKYHWPILQTAESSSLAGYADDYPILIRANSRKYTRAGAQRRAPQVVTYPDNEPVTEEMEAKEVYDGRWYRVTVNPFWFEVEEGNRGISLGLANVQLLKHDDPMGSAPANAAQEFEPSSDLDEEEEDMLA